MLESLDTLVFIVADQSSSQFVKGKDPLFAKSSCGSSGDAERLRHLFFCK